MRTHSLPRVLIAAPASGSGKTMITTGLLAALHRRGLVVSPHKVGPDYIDPGYHEAACARVGRNLDAHMVGVDRIVPLLLHGALSPSVADVAVIEGVMGLFDGALGREGFASSAHVAKLTQTPVILVVNCASASRSVGAVVHGFASFDSQVRVAGVILNNVASPRHEAEARAAVLGVGVPVVGCIPRLPDIVVPSRHLGLIPAAERRPEALAAVDALACMAQQHLDLDAIVEVAKSAPELEGQVWSPGAALASVGGVSTGSGVRVAVAGGAAFTFGYAENVELLEAAGAQVVSFDPLRDRELPEADALVIQGGFPEVYASALGANRSMLDAVRRFAASGAPVVAECAGMLYLAQELDGTQMTGVLPLIASMHPRLVLGYRQAVADCDSVLSAAGDRVTGHVFHRTRVAPAPDAGVVPGAWVLRDHADRVEVDGVVSGNVVAGYLHTHWAGAPQFAARLVAQACAWRGGVR
ncbi:Cobyrinic acid A,C-diamide synthase [Dermatophilus congolensis]|uniref:Hydrogenobyrinate a,c-diamide synthase n=1 Tax=Dermatophilus congolensis TaxID=1863 RepID=A0AA46H0J5_9MICO|nr:Cobyrinic acid A,C-diamide synthase [Dermatophilus congolensis]